MNFRNRICRMLAFLRIHRSSCKHCNARPTWRSELLKRLEELNWRTLKTDETAANSDVKQETTISA